MPPPGGESDHSQDLRIGSPDDRTALAGLQKDRTDVADGTEFVGSNVESAREGLRTIDAALVGAERRARVCSVNPRDSRRRAPSWVSSHCCLELTK